jgi:hypothetical protein
MNMSFHRVVGDREVDVANVRMLTRGPIINWPGHYGRGTL